MAIFSPAEFLSRHLEGLIEDRFTAHYGNTEGPLLGLMKDALTTSMEIINGTDALYHNCEHTVMVSLAGQDILAGKIALGDQVSAQQWATYVISLLFHDVGYIKRLLSGDTVDHVVVDQSGATQTLPHGATDAALTLFHVDRGMAFVAQKYASCRLLDVSAILENIENTRFPPPAQVLAAPCSRTRWPDMVRAADLIGQLAEPNYLQKLPALYEEYVECGTAQSMGLQDYRGLLIKFPEFFSKVVSNLVAEAFDALAAAPDGARWRESLDRSLAFCRAIGAGSGEGGPVNA